MVEFTERVHIASPVRTVWSALIDPEQVVQWDTGVVAPLDAPPDYPQPGQHVRWRYRLGWLPLVLHDRPTEVVACETLRSSIRLGPFAFDETYTLVPSGPSATELCARLRVASPLPLVGGWLARVAGGPLGRTTVRESLAAIRLHCEGRTPAPRTGP